MRLGLHNLGKFPMQPLAGNIDFLVGFESISAVVSDGLSDNIGTRKLERGHWKKRERSPQGRKMVKYM